MSRGCGYLQRRVLRLVEKNGGVTRAALEDRLCDEEGHRSDNLLRAIRGLARAGAIEYREARFASNCLVRPPAPFVPFTDEEIFEMLSQGEAGQSTSIPRTPSAHLVTAGKEHPEYARRRLNHG